MEAPKKQCTKCKEWYPATTEYFHRTPRGKYRLTSQCKKCLTAERNERYHKNIEHGREIARRSYLKHRVTKLAYARSRYKGSERMMAYYRAHPELTREKKWKDRARKYGIRGTLSVQEWDAIKAKYDHRCLSCGRREPEVKLVPDHVIPLSKGGAHDITNIQPLCIACNSSKKDESTDYRPKK